MAGTLDSIAQSGAHYARTFSPQRSIHPKGTLVMKSESLILPLLLLGAALLVEVGTRTLTLVDQRGQLKDLYGAQQERYRMAVDLRGQLEGVAADTARLAAGGNQNARQVIERLSAAGIQVNPDAKADAGN
jgi:hypothetical protein